MNVNISKGHGNTIENTKGSTTLTVNSFLQHVNPWIFYVLIAWSIAWKGWALWRAARLKHVGWYIALLIVNTVGIFEIIYLIVTNKKYSDLNGNIA